MTSEAPPLLEPSSASRELELKYAVTDADAVRELISGDVLAGFQATEWRVVDVADHYLDTHDRAIARAGYGARLRCVGRRTLVTIKSTRKNTGSRGRAGRRGLHDRLELEARATRQLRPDRWPQSPARALIEATAGGEALHTLFVLEQRREERDLLMDGTVIAKVSLDSGTVRRFGKPLGDLVTLEIEAVAPVTGAGRAALEAIADHLDESADLRPEQRSKEEQALALIDHVVTSARATRPPRQAGIEPDDLLAEAGRKVLRMHLLRMLAAEPGARSGDDIEGVHKMRVATRRMRAAWRVFSGAYRPRFQRRYVAELRTVARALGAVRDEDVQLERLAGYRAGLATDANAALEPLAKEWRRRRATSRSQLLDVLASGSYDQFISDYRAFVDMPGAGAVDQPRQLLRDVAAGRAWRAYERLRAHDHVVPFADMPALHALRIDAKRLRYTLEFVREILPAAADRVIADVVKLQDHVGLLNDAQIAADSTRAWLIDAAPGLTVAQREAATGYLNATENDIARLRREFRPIWRRITGPTLRRRLALVVGSV